jgi:hypothetical protein
MYTIGIGWSKLSQPFLWLVALVLIGPCARPAHAQGFPPTLTLEVVNGTVRRQLAPLPFQTGNVLELQATVSPGSPGTRVQVDAYIALQPPGCSSPSCFLFWLGGTNFTTIPQPILRNTQLTSAFRGTIFRFAFSGTEPAGTYVWFGALTVPGTVTLIGQVTQAPFTFSP